MVTADHDPTRVGSKRTPDDESGVDRKPAPIEVTQPQRTMETLPVRDFTSTYRHHLDRHWRAIARDTTATMPDALADVLARAAVDEGTWSLVASRLDQGKPLEGSPADVRLALQSTIQDIEPADIVEVMRGTLAPTYERLAVDGASAEELGDVVLALAPLFPSTNQSRDILLGVAHQVFLDRGRWHPGSAWTMLAAVQQAGLRTSPPLLTSIIVHEASMVMAEHYRARGGADAGDLRLERIIVRQLALSTMSLLDLVSGDPVEPEPAVHAAAMAVARIAAAAQIGLRGEPTRIVPLTPGRVESDEVVAGVAGLSGLFTYQVRVGGLVDLAFLTALGALIALETEGFAVRGFPGRFYNAALALRKGPGPGTASAESHNAGLLLNAIGPALAMTSAEGLSDVMVSQEGFDSVINFFAGLAIAVDNDLPVGEWSAVAGVLDKLVSRAESLDVPASDGARIRNSLTRLHASGYSFEAGDGTAAVGSADLLRLVLAARLRSVLGPETRSSWTSRWVLDATGDPAVLSELDLAPDADVTQDTLFAHVVDAVCESFDSQPGFDIQDWSYNDVLATMPRSHHDLATVFVTDYALACGGQIGIEGPMVAAGLFGPDEWAAGRDQLDEVATDIPARLRAFAV